MLQLSVHEKGRILAVDASTSDTLTRGFFGSKTSAGVEVSVEEALYLMDVRGAKCMNGGKEIGFGELAASFSKNERLMARYFTYKDWRDRGLAAVTPGSKHAKPHPPALKEYPSASLHLPKESLHGTLYPTDLVTVLDEKEAGKKLYNRFWIGQYGSYKASERGSMSKLDVYETLFLVNKGMLSLKNATRSRLVSIARKRRSDFLSLYGVYADWRDKGYVVKTGFKFGTHFRVYFPGAKPMESGSGAQAHSKHVIQVFPKSSKLLISEWARAIRVAHSVRKTLILAVPGKAGVARQKIDYALYHRHGGDADSPEKTAPRFAMLSLSEEEYIGGQEFSSAVNEAKRLGLEPLLAIADRETSVTYYRVTKIKLPGSRHDYFEIDWMQP